MVLNKSFSFYKKKQIKEFALFVLYKKLYLSLVVK